MSAIVGLKGDAADDEREGRPVKSELLHDAQREREARAPAVQELRQERNESGRVGRLDDLIVRSSRRMWV